MDSRIFRTAAMCVLAGTPALALAQQTADPLPQAPSAVLTEQAKKETDLGKTAGSGAVFTPASTQQAPDGASVEVATANPLPLSLDDAVSYGLSRNLRLKYDAATRREVDGLASSTISALIPNITLSAQSGAMEVNLAAMGFKPSLLAGVAEQFNIDPNSISSIVKINTTGASAAVSQELINLPDFEVWRAVKTEKAVVDLNYLNSRGQLVTAVGTAYLQVQADQANLKNAEQQEASSKLAFEQAVDRKKSGVGTNLDALRSEVDYKQRQQTTISSSSQLEKDVIQLNRIMGVPAEQQWVLTDTAPFAEFVDLDLQTAMSTAMEHRKDFLSLEGNIDVMRREYKAAKMERLPTLAFNGSYGFLGETTGMYHGVFNAQGTLKVPLFREAAQRGEERQVSAQLQELRDQEASIRTDIEAEIRSAMLDEQSSHDLVAVGQSKVEMTKQELSDAEDRYKSGVDDNLPVLTAEASVTEAQAELVQALYQYNVSKLNLAQATGVVESRYRTYLGK
ncbi:MAG: TolC family protein [Acidobacteriaceae bacterium]|nr:TolC family protein [Acidobacteriaceae bacterium]